MNTIHWSPKAVRQLRKLDKTVQVAIVSGVNTLADMPNCRNVKALTNHACGYRLRVGQYRVLFDWYDAIRIVEVQEVRKRDERTY